MIGLCQDIANITSLLSRGAVGWIEELLHDVQTSESHSTVHADTIRAATAREDCV